MKSITLVSPVKWRSLPGLAAALVTLNAIAAWHDDFRGSDTSVHYVRLKGYGGDNDSNRKNLAVSYEACVATLSAFGRKPASLPPKGLPEIVSSQQIEIYYGVNQTLTVKQGTLQVVDQKTCAITGVSHRMLEIRSTMERCDIDLIKNEAHGMCDTLANQHASEVAENRERGRLPTADHSKVPPEMRAQFDVQLARLAKLPHVDAKIGAAAAMNPTGQHKNVVATSCEVWRSPSLPYELCIANLVPTPGRRLNPDHLSTAPLNAGVPGLLLEARTPALTLRAEEVRLNLSVAHDLFAVPASVKMKSAAGEMP